MHRIDKALLIVATATAFLLVATIIATAGERDLEDVNRDVNRYWASVRAEANERLNLEIQQQQLEALRGIEQNTEGR
jgi:hypothetical protein